MTNAISELITPFYSSRDLPRNFIKTLSISVSSSPKSKITMAKDNLIGEHYMGVCMHVCVCGKCMYVCVGKHISGCYHI